MDLIRRLEEMAYFSNELTLGIEKLSEVFDPEEEASGVLADIIDSLFIRLCAPQNLIELNRGTATAKEKLSILSIHVRDYVDIIQSFL